MKPEIKPERIWMRADNLVSPMREHFEKLNPDDVAYILEDSIPTPPDSVEIAKIRERPRTTTQFRSLPSRRVIERIHCKSCGAYWDIPDEDEHHKTSCFFPDIDTLLAAYTASQAEAGRLRQAIDTHRRQKADDRCIEDDDVLYAALEDNVRCDRHVGDKSAMLNNCARFISNRCEGGKWPSYVDLEAEIDAFWSALHRSWDIEPREFFEKEAPGNGFKHATAMAVHYLWKRERRD